MDAMTLKAIAAGNEAANQAWVQGEWESGYGALLTESEDGCIYGPLGGPLLSAAGWRLRGPQAVREFRDGKSRLQVRKLYASGNLLVLVTLEEQTATIAEKPDRPWSLRVTQVYRLEGADWKVIHRHADPFVRYRGIPETVELASGS